jgi:hypothetical protein
VIIPKTITVGPVLYDVKCVPHLDNPPAHGRLNTVEGTIKVATHSIFGLNYPHRDRCTAFWHETLHACMLDMGIPLHKHDENFVERLAKRLQQVCDSAEV